MKQPLAAYCLAIIRAAARCLKRYVQHGGISHTEHEKRSLSDLFPYSCT
ncbi:hypothetical protein [Pseudomonas chlororaphis]|nr:hypothetical protein [Pseudomonas chlororaphis]